MILQMLYLILTEKHVSERVKIEEIESATMAHFDTWFTSKIRRILKFITKVRLRQSSWWISTTYCLVFYNSWFLSNPFCFLAERRKQSLELITLVPEVFFHREERREREKREERERERSGERKPLVMGDSFFYLTTPIQEPGSRSDPASWLEEYFSVFWLSVNCHRCVVIGCLLIDLVMYNWHLS